MPNINVKIPAHTFDAVARKCLIDGINTAAVEAEHIPDDPRKRMLCCITLEEVPASFLTCDGKDISAVLIPVLVQVNVPIGVLDNDARAKYAAGIQQAAMAALPGEQRRIASSCIINEVIDGSWGIDGAIWRLPDFAKHAGFMHLQALMK